MLAGVSMQIFNEKLKNMVHFSYLNETRLNTIQSKLPAKAMILSKGIPYGQFMNPKKPKRTVTNAT